MSFSLENEIDTTKIIGSMQNKQNTKSIIWLATLNKLNLLRIELSSMSFKRERYLYLLF